MRFKNLSNPKIPRGSYFILLFLLSLTTVLFFSFAFQAVGSESDEDEFIKLKNSPDPLEIIQQLSMDIKRKLKKNQQKAPECDIKDIPEAFLNLKSDFNLNLALKAAYGDVEFETECQREDVEAALLIGEELLEEFKKSYQKGNCAESKTAYRKDIKRAKKYLLEDFIDLLSQIVDNSRNLPFYRSSKVGQGKNSAKKEKFAKENQTSAPTSRAVSQPCPRSKSEVSESYKKVSDNYKKAVEAGKKLENFALEPSRSSISEFNPDISSNTAPNYEAGNKRSLNNPELKKKDVDEKSLPDLISKMEKEEELPDLLKKSRTSKEETENSLYFLDWRNSNAVWILEQDLCRSNLSQSMEIEALLLEEMLSNLKQFNTSLESLLQKQCGG